MKDTKPTKEQDEEFDKIEDEMEACAKKAGGDAPRAALRSNDRGEAIERIDRPRAVPEQIFAVDANDACRR